ncbi:MAG: bifunctional SulP family inorganic anion transporter/carbonic anhydrase [Planctomycetaceae bacterium]|nr:bifunctional SulP family inorganic anion transporter/carbonic anhydrase [Planctomycetaceae bacterium]
MTQTRVFSRKTILQDLIAGTVVFLVALPLCMGVAMASNAPIFSGILAGAIGGIIVGILSKSHTSVSGPSPALIAVVASQIVALGSFEAFLTAVVVAGLIQIAMGVLRLGFISAFFPSAVIKGLLAAVGVILILKQIPHLVGHDTDPEGEMAFLQPDHENTFSEFLSLLGDLHVGAAIIGIASFSLLIFWDRFKVLKKSIVPAPLVVIAFGVFTSLMFSRWGGMFAIGPSHLVQVPIAESLGGITEFLRTPDFGQILTPGVWIAAATIAIVASLETLLNLEAVDRLDPRQRTSPANPELIAQGCGNLVAGLIGGIPISSVIVRSSVNINSGGRTKLSAIIHGFLLLISVVFLPQYLNLIPISCLAAILLATGIKLASPVLMVKTWHEGRYQFLPFILTVIAIVMTDLLIGILIGLGISVAFILNSNLRRPIRRRLEKHLGGDVLHIELANQVSFLNRAALERALDEIPRGGHLLLDARNTDYIDPDIQSYIREFISTTAPVRGVRVSLRGFREKYELKDEIQYVDYSTRELQDKMTPDQVLQILKDGNERFRTGQQLSRDLSRQMLATADGQHPLAVVLSCIDSRTPAELVFDLGLGDIFSVRVAGNVTSPKVLGSMEYGCAVAGAKLILVLGHTRCGAVTASVSFTASKADVKQETGCDHVDHLVQDIRRSIDPVSCEEYPKLSKADQAKYVDDVAKQNVRQVMARILEESSTIARLVAEKKVVVVGAMYDVNSGSLQFV